MSPIFRRNKTSGFVLAITVGLLIGIAIQYPLSVTYPMGGDAPAYIIVAKGIINEPLSWTSWRNVISSWYPLAHLSFLPFTTIPTSWPMRFVWWATAGQVAVGVALGWLLYRLFNWHVAAAGVALWAITPIMAIRHFEDGTIAQLWSYVPLLLFLERWHTGKLAMSLVFGVATLLTHALTGLLLIIAVFVTIMTLTIFQKWIQPNKDYNSMALIAKIMMALAILTGLVLWKRRSVFQYFLTDSNTTYGDFIFSPFLPLILLAPLGLLLLIRQLKSNQRSLLMLMEFTLVASFFGLNDWFGINVLTNRFLPILVLSICLIAAPAIIFIIYHAFSTPVARGAAAILLLTMSFGQIWPRNARVYNFYESPSRYARIHPSEIEAIEWMESGIPGHSPIISSNVNRHSEWIPVLTNHEVIIREENKLLTSITRDLAPRAYVAFFIKRESLPKEVVEHKYPIVFANEGVVIIRGSNE